MRCNRQVYLLEYDMRNAMPLLVDGITESCTHEIKGS